MEDIGEDDPGVSLATATSTDALRELTPAVALDNTEKSIYVHLC